MQSVFAERSFESTQSRRSILVLVQGNDLFNVVSQPFLLFYVKSDDVTVCEEDLAFVQYFGVAPPVHNTDKDRNGLFFNSHNAIE